VRHLALVIVFGAFATQLDTSIVNVGLDTIGRDLDAPLATIQWVATAYLLALAVALPACGWLGRRFGVGRVWLACLAAFTVASGLCALAPTAEWLIVLRILQGLAAGLLVPAGQALLGQAVGPERLGRVMAKLGIAVSLAPALGPVVGGLIVDGLSWRWMFLINLPIGVVGLLLARGVVPTAAGSRAAQLDRGGLGLVSVGLPLLVYAVTRAGERASLTATDLVPLAVGAGCLIAYGLHARRHPHPLLDLRLYRKRAYAAASAAAAFGGATLFGAAIVFPLYFQLLRGQDALATGLSLVALGAGTAAIMPLAGWLTDRYGGGVVATTGAAMSVATTLPFALLTADAANLVLQALLLLRGAAIGLTVMPVVAAAYAAVASDQLPDATTQVNIVQRLGGAIGGAIFAVVLARTLPDGAEHAFATAFWWLTGASLLALVTAAWLWHEQHISTERRNP
jgi:EmrB/QacA subfamily drug resistance transporter